MGLLDSVALPQPLVAGALFASLAVVTLLVARRSWADLSPARSAVATAARLALLLMLCLALGGLQWRRVREDVATVLAVDSSDSMGASMSAAAALARAAVAGMQRGDRAAVVQFGREALVDEPLREEPPALPLASHPKSDGSDLGAALRLARGVLPADGRRRVVVVTDGALDASDPFAAADAADLIRALRDEGIEVALLPVDRVASEETLVEAVSAPPRSHEGEPFEVRVLLRSSSSGHGRLTLARDGEIIGQSQVELPGGPVAYRFVERNAGAGTHVYRAHLEAEPDGFEQNDAAEALVRVEGAPSVLLLDPDPASLAAARGVLEAAGLRVHVRPSLEAPVSLAEAASHQAIVLSNVDSLDMTTSQMALLRAFVRETGGGLLMAGGPSSFGPGGWYDTPVEEALPVDMDVRNEKYFPSLALLAVIDKSGSMGGGATSKIDLAKEALLQTSELLQQGDTFGVVAFDSAAKWVVPSGRLGDGRHARELIGTLRAGGGTDVYPGLVLAAEAVEQADTMLKHVIVLSDGMTAPRDFLAILKRIRAAGGTVSGVAIGSDADLYTMQVFAHEGGGRYYFTDDSASIPRIFTKEALSTARSFVVEESFVPALASEHSVLRGALPLPPLRGYVATTAKPAAQVLLATHREDPLLALRQFGLGRSAALATDLGARWAPGLVATEQGRTLLAQLVRWLSARSDSSLLEARLESAGGKVRISIEARDEAGGFLDFADLSASVVGPDLAAREVRVPQVAPGRYEAWVDGAQAGAWFAGIVQRDGDRVVRGTSAAQVIPWSDEYRSLEPAREAVARLAAQSGASVLANPVDAFARTGTPAASLRPAWRELVLACALLLLVDVALRRVLLPEGWAATTAAWLRARLGRRAAEAPTPVLARLQSAKAAARPRVEPRAAPATRSPAQAPAPSAAAPAAPAPTRGSDALLSTQLLAARRRARKELR